MQISPNVGLWGLLFIVGIGLSACSGDAGAKDPQGDAGADVDTLADSVEHDTRAGDTTSPEPPEDAADDTAADTDPSPQDAADDSSAPGELLPDAGHQGCTHPADPQAGCAPEDFGDWGPASFINHFQIEKSGSCCADFNDDGTDDSAMGNLIHALSAVIGVPFNDVIATQIRNGGLVLLLEYAYLSDPQNDPALQLSLVFGADTDDYFTPNLNGTGDFYVKRESLDEDGQVRSDFPTASVEQGRLSAAEASAAILLPLNLDATLMGEVQIERLSMQADVLPDADLRAGGRVTLENGRLGGAVSLGDFFATINKMASTCDCIRSQPLFIEESPNRWACVRPIEHECELSPDPLCAGLSVRQQCELIAEAVTNQKDVDLDGDGLDDALSFGATFSAVGASIQGVVD